TTMQTPVLLGREIDERDIQAGASVAVVNEEFAKRYYANENPIGRHFGLGGTQTGNYEIIGVSKTARYSSLKRDTPPVAYVPYSHNHRSLEQMVYELRAQGDPLALISSARQVVRQADARIPVSNVDRKSVV